MATHSRWKQAQSYERAHWQSVANKIKESDGPSLSWYKWRAENLGANVEKAFPDDTPGFEDSQVLEVGSGPVGLVSALKAKKRIALDPLCDFFSTQPSLIEFRSPEVEYVNATGEGIPLEDQSCDMVVIENVIDHVQNASGVMKEINRVLKPNGILYFTVNLHPRWGAFLHEIVSRLRIDKGHPHTFTIKKIRKFLTGFGFKSYFEEWEDYRECRANDWKSDSRRAKMKAISGLSEYLYTSVLRKQDPAG